MQRATYQGSLIRNSDELRPFVLTRAFFIGSQKFGTYWTGDNAILFEEMQGSILQLIQAGLSGLHFGGADIPGYHDG